MSYFKIYPRKIVAEPGDDTTRKAELFYNLEQYGHLHPDRSCALELFRDEQATPPWTLKVLNPDIQVKKFTDFITALQFYLFQVLKYKPPELTPGGSVASQAYFFEPVYFDMLDGRFKTASAPQDPPGMG
jgi:hypothetical protein